MTKNQSESIEQTRGIKMNNPYTGVNDYDELFKYYGNDWSIKYTYWNQDKGCPYLLPCGIEPCEKLGKCPGQPTVITFSCDWGTSTEGACEGEQDA